MTQVALAATCGVSKWAQINFEKDENVPGGSYLLAASDSGVDIGYVLVGVRSIFVRGMTIEDREALTVICDQYMNLPDELRFKAIDAMDRISNEAIKAGTARFVRRRHEQE